MHNSILRDNCFQSAPVIFTTASEHSTLSRDALGDWTASLTDVVGRPTLTIFNDGTFTQILYAEEGQTIAGHPLGVDQTPGTSRVLKIDQMGEPTDYLYDVAGRLVDVYLPAVPDGNPHSPAFGEADVRPHWHYTYDAAGNQTQQTAPVTYNASGDALNGTTSYAYDEYGRRTARQAPGLGSQEQWKYDDYGRVIEHSDPAGNATWYDYDDTSAHGGRLKAEYRYTGNFNPTGGWTATYAESNDTYAEKTVYTYDTLGRVTRVEDDARVSGAVTMQTFTATAYDSVLGSVATVTTPEGVIHYEYDSETGQHTRTYTDQTDTEYGYDPMGRMTTVHVTKLAGQTVDQLTMYSFDDAGNLLTVTQPTGLTTTYTYDHLNRLKIETVTTADTTEISRFTYALRADGLRSSVTEHQEKADISGTFSDVKISWRYDDDGRLISEYRDTGNDNSDPASMGAGDYKDTFIYDPEGNRMSKVHEETGTANDETVTYVYAEGDRLILETGAGNTTYQNTYSYDGNSGVDGNQTAMGRADGSSVAYSWDLRGRMISAYDNQGTSSVTIYTYTTDGVRESETTTTNSVTGPTTFYLNDANNPTGYSKVIDEKQGATLSAATIAQSYVLGLKVEGQSSPSENIATSMFYYLTDGHGSTRALVDLEGAINQRYDYDAYGKLIAGANLTSTGMLTNNLFGGDGVYDPATGWTYHLARWRSDFRFVSYDSSEADPTSPASLHKFLYVGGNSINYRDPSGHGFIGDTITAVGIAAAFMATQMPVITVALGYTTLVALGVYVASSPLAYYEANGDLRTGKFFRTVRDDSWFTAEIGSLVYFLAASAPQSESAEPPPQQSEAELESEAAQAASRLGFNLKSVKVDEGTAEIPINFTQNINKNDVTVLQKYLQSRGATSAVINTGPVINKGLERALENPRLIGRILNGVAEVENLGFTDPILTDKPVFQITLTLPKK